MATPTHKASPLYRVRESPARADVVRALAWRFADESVFSMEIIMRLFFFVFFVLYDLRLRRRTSPLERRRRLTRPLLSTVLVPPARALAWRSDPERLRT